MSYRIAVAGATGNVGRELLLLLEERNFPVSEIIPLASARSAGKKIEYKDTQLVCQDLAKNKKRH